MSLAVIVPPSKAVIVPPLESGNSTALEYQLYADGTGAETLLSEPVVQSALSWQTTSANTMTTTFDQSGASNSFTDIQFAGENTVSLVLSNGSTCSVNANPRLTRRAAQATLEDF